MGSIHRIGCAASLALLALLSGCLAEHKKHSPVPTSIEDDLPPVNLSHAKPLVDHEAEQSWRKGYLDLSPFKKRARQGIELLATTANWEKFKKSPLFVEPAEEGFTQMPVEQLKFQLQSTRENLIMYKEILADAIKHKDNLFAAARLVAKWGLRLINSLREAWKEENATPDRYKPNPDFFNRMADALSVIIDRSKQLKVQKGYSKRTVDVVNFERRVNDLIDLVRRIMEVSSVGVYLKWDTVKLFADEPRHPLYLKDAMEESSDLFAQFRGIGYEAAAMVARQLVNLMRMFAKGQSE